MLTFSQFGAQGIPAHTKLYRNNRIVTVIRNMFFVGGSLAYAHQYNHRFPKFTGSNGVEVREVPVPMVALVATAVSSTYQHRCHTNWESQLYAAIHEWRTGVHQAYDFLT